MKPKLFVGSSTEGLHIAKNLHLALEHFADVTIWTDNVFQISATTFHSITQALDRSDYAAFVISNDDSLVTRGKRYDSPRDNVLFELGLFTGRIGIERTFIVFPRGSKIKMPSDLAGITLADFQISEESNLLASVRSAATKIELAIQNIQKNKQCVLKTNISWPELCSHVASIGEQLRQSPHRGGFMPDIIVDISRGGIIIADLLSRFLGGRIQIMCLWADRYAELGTASFQHSGADVNQQLISLLQDKYRQNVLLVDDISRTGKTIQNAKAFICSSISIKSLRTVTLAIRKGVTPRPDYWAYEFSEHNHRLPFSLLG